MKLLSLLLSALLCCATLACVSPVPSYEQLVMRPNVVIDKTPQDYGFDYEEFSIQLAPERTVVGWFVPSVESSSTLVIIPGSDANKGRYAEALPLLVTRGYNVVLMDYEGYGSSTGSPPALWKALQDAEAVVDYAKTKSTKVFVYSVSLGTPIAASVASTRNLAGVIFEGTFIPREEPRLWLLNQNPYTFPGFWWLANLWSRPQIPDEYDIEQTICHVFEPKLFLHSRDDSVTPYSGAQLIFSLAPEPKAFVDLQGDHGGMVRLNPEKYAEILTSWLDSH